MGCGAPVEDLALVDDQVDRVEPGVLAAGQLAGNRPDNAGRPFSVVEARDLPHAPFEHFGGGLGVLVSAALNQGDCPRCEHRPVAVALQISDMQLNCGIQRQPEREQAQHGGLALF